MSLSLLKHILHRCSTAVLSGFDDSRMRQVGWSQIPLTFNAQHLARTRRKPCNAAIARLHRRPVCLSLSSARDVRRYLPVCASCLACQVFSRDFKVTKRFCHECGAASYCLPSFLCDPRPFPIVLQSTLTLLVLEARLAKDLVTPKIWALFST